MNSALDPRVISTVKRYISYGWKNDIIISLVRFRFDAPLISACVDNIRDAKPCSARCLEHCRLRDVRIWHVPCLWENFENT